MWDYGYSFFLAAYRASVEHYKRQILAGAMSIGLVLGGQKAMTEFMRERKDVENHRHPD